MNIGQVIPASRLGTMARTMVLPLFLIGLAACQSSAPPMETVALGGTSPVQGEYELGSGDRVRVTVFGQQDLSGEFAVDGSGQIAIPLVGGIAAKGLSARELEQKITTALSDGYVREPRVSVEVLNFRPFYIIGEVNSPGQYPYASGMTAVSAVALAGGYTYRAKEDHVLITRTVDGVKQERSAPPNTPVLPDDVIRVPERFF